MEQTAIRHGAGAAADVVGELRARQDDHGRIADRREPGTAVATGHFDRTTVIGVLRLS
jgi:hypothetical protein